jgi:hypothetical protein
MARKTISYKNISTLDITKQGEEIYQYKLKKKLEPKFMGSFVVIDPETEDYFIASDPMEANKKALKKHPNKIFYLKKIGFKTTYHLPASGTASSVNLSITPNYNIK